MQISIFGRLFQRLSARAALTVAVLCAASGCSTWPWFGNSSNTAAMAPAAASAAAAAPCPNAQARYMTCPNGVKLLTYEASFELQRYCAPLQALEGKIRGFDRNQPMHKIADGERAMLVGLAGWLILPRETEILDAPAAAAAWWNNRACTMPAALRL